jgi:hypothetical protein
MPKRLTILLFLVFCWTGCTGPTDEPFGNHGSPFGAAPLAPHEVTLLRKKFPGNWKNPARAKSPDGPDERILHSMAGKLRIIEQKVKADRGMETTRTRIATAFMDPSGRYLIGRDLPAEKKAQGETLFAIFHDKEAGIYRGVSWTKDLRGKEWPTQMAGRGIPGKNEIEWKPFFGKAHVGNTSRLHVRSRNSFTWTIRLFKGGQLKGEMVNTSQLTQSWPEEE